ncbi:MAG: polysaccharide biosynthesis tyrosine autokinase [Smithella sp.]|jgi:protein-tyrosine kinase
MGKMFDALQKVQQEKHVESEDKVQKSVPDDLVLDDKLVSFFAPSSMVTEQFRRMRTLIKLGVASAPKTIMVTSAISGEGKSFVAANLASIIAVELHSHALLVDCDLRNPSITRLFGLQEKKGLSDYLTGKAEIRDLLIKTSIDKLSILSGGNIQDNPVELVGSNKMKTLIQDLKSRYDDRYIIIDSSPLLATTEPSVLNEMVDGIILVIKSGDTPRETIQQAIKLLNKNKILGVVLNNMQFKTEAMFQRYFGTNRQYYDYRYAKMHPEPGFLGKLSLFINNIKVFFQKLWPSKK